MRDYTREQLLALTPDRYLSEGWVDASGQPRRELTTDYATAVATQLLQAKLSPQELGFTVEALEQLLEAGEGPPDERLFDALEEALGVVGRMIGQDNNKGLVEWLTECVNLVQTDADLAAFRIHLHAVLRLYSVLASLPAPDSVPS